MVNSPNALKVRTTPELGIVISLAGALVGAVSLISLFFVKSFGSALIILLVPTVYALGAYLISLKFKKALVMNVVSYDGVRNERFGSTICSLEWNEIGDFGVAKVREGIFKGRYVYMSRIFVANEIRGDIVRRYDPRICVVMPYSPEICDALREASHEKIDIK